MDHFHYIGQLNIARDKMKWFNETPLGIWLFSLAIFNLTNICLSGSGEMHPSKVKLDPLIVKQRDIQLHLTGDKLCNMTLMFNLLMNSQKKVSSTWTWWDDVMTMMDCWVMIAITDGACWLGHNLVSDISSPLKWILTGIIR